MNYHFLHKPKNSWTTEPGGNNARFEKLGKIGPLRLVWLALTPGPVQKAAREMVGGLLVHGPKTEFGVLFLDSGELVEYDELIKQLKAEYE